MKNKEKKILLALGDINEKYLEQARPRERKNHTARILTVAASFVVVVGIALGVILLGGNTPPTGDVPPIVDIPFPEVPRTDKSLAAVMQDYLNSNIGSDDVWEDDGIFDESGNAPDMILPEGGSDSGSNGSYVEVTDNQVQGIIEGDLYKTTDKYIFRYRDRSLCIYSIDGENSEKISVTQINSNGNKNEADMFLSADGNTVTIIQSEYVTEIYEYENYTRYSGHYVTRIYSIDVSDAKNPVVAKTLELSGLNHDVRKIDDKIYLVTSHSFNKSDIDIDDPETYIPSISGDDTHLCDLERIYYCDEIKKATYSYVTVFDEDDLSLVSEFAILSETAHYVTDVCFTDNHIIFEYQSGKKISEEEATSEAYSWIELVDFSGDELRYRGSLEVKGWAEAGQYSYDEQDGYLRVVTSTRIWKRYWVEKSSASLYVYDLSTMSLTASVEDFAPDGERATAVRFEGDSLYVCTAETAKFTDPVFFFDLSDYGNITQVNTGYIEGFSSSLIDLGEGYLLGIGKESVSHSKIEIYKREGESVVSVAKQVFRGNYDTDYHAYLIDREKNLFGLAVNYTKEGYGVSYGHGYFLWHFDTNTESLSLLTEISGDTMHTYFGYARAFVREGYLYLTSVNEFTPFVVRRVEVK
ncbi:MAG: beta-propeller domain-containing protein [Clostridia bacterium]|nr:beta-propeller domain-containing protein [Clostridia bacterium]